MTDNEIKKALECCCKNNNCEGCPLDYLTFSSQCASELAIKSLELINRLQAENERLKKAKYIFANVDYCADDLDKALEENDRLKAENKSLKNAYKQCAWERDVFQTENERLTHITRNLIGEIKAEAYQEFADKVHTEIHQALESNYKARAEREQKIPVYTTDEFMSYCAGKIDCLRGIDNFIDETYNEMVGEDNA